MSIKKPSHRYFLSLKFEYIPTDANSWIKIKVCQIRKPCLQKKKVRKNLRHQNLSPLTLVTNIGNPHTSYLCQSSWSLIFSDTSQFSIAYDGIDLVSRVLWGLHVKILMHKRKLTAKTSYLTLHLSTCNLHVAVQVNILWFKIVIVIMSHLSVFVMFELSMGMKWVETSLWLPISSWNNLDYFVMVCLFRKKNSKL